MLLKLLIGLVALIVIAIIGFTIYINSAPPLPEGAEKIIQQVLASNDLPELINGQTGFAKNGAVTIWYEVMGELDTSKGTILLVMGHSSTAMIWTANFYQPLIDAGYQVIRYDNRGVGESSWMKDWSKQDAYTLEDMAKDGMAVLDAVGVEKAHIIGVSMGGMIAQRMAISHADRVRSLTSIMSSGYMADKSLPGAPRAFTTALIKLIFKYQVFQKNEINAMKFGVAVSQLLKGSGPYEVDIKYVAQRSLYELQKRKGRNVKVGNQHTQAITISGSRLEELKNLSLPTLVIHGKADPLVPFVHGQKCAEHIPNADTLFIEGMGHDMPQYYMDQFHAAIFKNLEKARLLTEN